MYQQWEVQAMVAGETQPMAGFLSRQYRQGSGRGQVKRIASKTDEDAQTAENSRANYYHNYGHAGICNLTPDHTFRPLQP